MGASDYAAHPQRHEPQWTRHHLLFHGPHVVEREIGIELPHDPFDGWSQLQRVAGRACDQRGVAAIGLSERLEEHGPGLIRDRPEAAFAHDADHFEGFAVHGKAFSQGIFVGPEMSGENTVDDHDAWGGFIVVGGKIPAFQNGDAHGP